MRTREHIFGEDMMKLTGILLVIAAAMAWIDAFFGRRRIRPRGDLLDTADLGRKFVFIGPGRAISPSSMSLAGERAVDVKNGGKADSNKLLEVSYENVEK